MDGFAQAQKGKMMNDLISRQAAIDAANKLIDRFERILRDIRETNEDESVCGMCEYDGAFIGESGDWCNECPGVNRADCFKLSEECRKRWLKELNLTSAQPQRMRGRWKRTYLDHEAMGERPSIFYCSACNQCIAYPTNYCPSCGADMRGEQDEH